ncbi:1,5-anhydro-D-fructose reductase-like [Melanaphis sacchari]|uniref:1,5-anhydro-D-fructose reductase-like n=1 Tax=Melanaphis sacchari TaxID=742174 RepID=UPI000DC14928|nr:1,5-anhydro-D-fructose reductase-like [Melanaphis sacchari]
MLMLISINTIFISCITFDLHIMAYFKLQSGGRMPAIGYGTFMATELELEKSLNIALETGYRFIDTAARYNNEAVIGKVLNEWISAGKVTREELFIQTKLPCYGNRAEDVDHYIKQSLENLQLDYIDMYLIHHPIGLFKNGKSDYSEMEIDKSTDHLKIWKKMEDQVHNGRTKAIGLSNFNIKQVQRILDNCKIKPENLQNENHLYLQSPEVVEFCKNNSIIFTSYSSLGMKAFRELAGLSWKNEQLPNMLENEVLVNIAKKHGKTPAQVLLRFINQKGVSIIPKSTNPQRIVENFQIFDFKLDAGDMDALRSQDNGEGGRIVRITMIKNIADHPEYPF